MRIAFVEWLLLSRTSLIIHPFWSSFAEEASIVHMTPRVMVREWLSCNSLRVLLTRLNADEGWGRNRRF